jgi:hypothetical protein
MNKLNVSPKEGFSQRRAVQVSLNEFESVTIFRGRTGLRQPEDRAIREERRREAI